MLRNYHIFISHSWAYSYHYETLKKWLSEAPYFTWSDYSVPITNPLDVNSTRELKLKLHNRISNSSCVIILSAMYATHSHWIDFEIDSAVAMNKPIIGIRPWGQERVPQKIQEHATILIGWNSSPLIQAVRCYAL